MGQGVEDWKNGPTVQLSPNGGGDGRIVVDALPILGQEDYWSTEEKLAGVAIQ